MCYSVSHLCRPTRPFRIPSGTCGYSNILLHCLNFSPTLPVYYFTSWQVSIPSHLYSLRSNKISSWTKWLPRVRLLFPVSLQLGMGLWSNFAPSGIFMWSLWKTFFKSLKIPNQFIPLLFFICYLEHGCDRPWEWGPGPGIVGWKLGKKLGPQNFTKQSFPISVG